MLNKTGYGYIHEIECRSQTTSQLSQHVLSSEFFHNVTAVKFCVKFGNFYTFLSHNSTNFTGFLYKLSSSFICCNLFNFTQSSRSSLTASQTLGINPVVICKFLRSSSFSTTSNYLVPLVSRLPPSD
jgi:hypothetical protein